MLDILQGWGEAFSTHRREIYPHIVASYSKTRYKYGIQYPRSDYDPTRSAERNKNHKFVFDFSFHINFE